MIKVSELTKRYARTTAVDHISFEVEKGQIVGFSFPCATGPDGPNVHGFLWQNGFMTDLNALLPPSSSLTPWGDGAFINDRGEIAGVRVLPDGDLHAFVLVPCREGDEGCHPREPSRLDQK